MAKNKLIQTLLGELHTKLDHLDNLVQRDATFPNAPNKIKVVTGMRRVGKTYFLFQLIQDLLKQGVDRKRILFINFEDDRLLPRTTQTLADLIDDFYALYPENHAQKCYIFLDEIQNVEDWPLVIRRLHDTKQVELFLTGSSAKLLSKEIASSLRGRSLALELWPYSFKEFMRAKNISLQPQALYTKEKQDILMQLFKDYLLIGGFPEVTHSEPDVRQQTLQDYLDLVIYRDIIERHTVKNPRVIKYMMLSLIQGTAAPFSINKFYNDIRSQGYKTGKDILYKYEDFIEDAFAAFFVENYTESLRKRHASPKKVYAIDPGMVRALVFNYARDLGRLFENVIYLDLRRSCVNVSYYRTKNGNEVDFVIRTASGHTKCFQVAWQQEHEETAQRELRGLEEGMRELNADGEIITLESYLENGIIL